MLRQGKPHTLLISLIDIVMSFLNWLDVTQGNILLDDETLVLWHSTSLSCSITHFSPGFTVVPTFFSFLSSAIIVFFIYTWDTNVDTNMCREI